MGMVNWSHGWNGVCIELLAFLDEFTLFPVATKPALIKAHKEEGGKTPAYTEWYRIESVDPAEKKKKTTIPK